jgi:hypothetical protein
VLPGRGGCGSQNAAAQSVGQRDRVEIKQQADAAAREAKIGQKLRFVKWAEAVDRFDLQNDLVMDDDVSAIGAWEIDAVVVDRQGRLAGVRDLGAIQFVGQASFVDGFEQARSKAAVDTHGKTDDSVCEIGVQRDASWLRSSRMGGRGFGFINRAGGGEAIKQS